MPLYENSVIYKLVHCNDQDNENIYIGSTTNFRGRKSEHKCNCYNSKDKRYTINVYCFIREKGGWEEWLMIPIEVYPCNNKRELEVKERYYIELMKPKLNKVIPTRTYKEYREDNKELIKEHQKQYNEANKEHIKARGKQYREANKEHIKAREKQYKEANKKKVDCECGCKLYNHNLKKHQTSKKHIQIMEERI